MSSNRFSFVVPLFAALRKALKFPVLVASKAWLRSSGAVVPRSSKVEGFPSVIGMKGTLVLGERVYLQCLRMLYSVGSPFPTCSFFILPGAVVEIGDDTYISTSAISALKRISIGKRVLIAGGCRIFDGDGHIVDQIPRTAFAPDVAEAIVIEDDVWLGCDVMVCKGVTIGKGSVIGAKSIVTHDIPPGVLAAGMPAQVIRPLHLSDKA